MALKYVSKVFLIFKLPDGSTREGFFRQSQRLGEIIASFGGEGKAKLGKRKLDISLTISELQLKNDDLIFISK
jgi:hypothetical protein